MTAFARISPGEPAGDALAVLDPLSRHVVTLSLREGAEGFGRRSVPSRIMAALFGVRRPAPLADPGLETLRRFCILCRLGEQIAAAMLEQELRMRGRSGAELQAIRDWIAERLSPARAGARGAGSPRR